MKIYILRDYPDSLGETIQMILHSDYTVTGYYGDTGLEWVIEYRGSRDTTLLEIACSEYILDSTVLNTVYNMDDGVRWWMENKPTEE